MIATFIYVCVHYWLVYQPAEGFGYMFFWRICWLALCTVLTMISHCHWDLCDHKGVIIRWAKNVPRIPNLRFQETKYNLNNWLRNLCGLCHPPPQKNNTFDSYLEKWNVKETTSLTLWLNTDTNKLSKGVESCPITHTHREDGCDIFR